MKPYEEYESHEAYVKASQEEYLAECRIREAEGAVKRAAEEAVKAKQKVMTVGDLARILSTLNQDMKILIELEDEYAPRKELLYDNGVVLYKGGNRALPEKNYLLLSEYLINENDGVTPLC